MRSPGPAGGAGVSGGHGGPTGGTRRLCRRPVECHKRPESAGQRTSTGRSPSAAPVGEIHTQGTPEEQEKEGGRERERFEQ